MLTANYLETSFIGFLIYFIVNFLVWIILSRSFKKSYFYLSFFYAASVSIVEIPYWLFFEFIAPWLKSWARGSSWEGPSSIAMLISVLVMFFCAYFLLPRYIIKKYAPNYFSAKTINWALIISFILIVIVKIVIYWMIFSFLIKMGGGWDAIVEKLQSLRANVENAQLNSQSVQ